MEVMICEEAFYMLDESKVLLNLKIPNNSTLSLRKKKVQLIPIIL